MSRKRYEPGCEGCRPAIVDVRTGEMLPDDHPIMSRALAAYDSASEEERRAWHAVTCLNSRDQEDVRLAKLLVGHMVP